MQFLIVLLKFVLFSAQLRHRCLIICVFILKCCYHLPQTGDLFFQVPGIVGSMDQRRNAADCRQQGDFDHIFQHKFSSG